MLRPPLCSFGDLLCLWNSPASLPSWDSHCKPPALQDNSSLHFSRHHSAGLGHLWGQKKNQDMDAGKCYPPSSIGACNDSPVEPTQCLTPVNRRLNIHELLWAQERYYRDGCLGMKLKKQVSSKKRRKTSFQTQQLPWNGWAGRTGARQLPWTGKHWFERGCRETGREDGSKCSLVLEIIPITRNLGLAHIHSQQLQMDMMEHSLEVLPWQKKLLHELQNLCLGAGVIACLINLKPWLKVFPSSVYFYILFKWGLSAA